MLCPYGNSEFTRQHIKKHIKCQCVSCRHRAGKNKAFWAMSLPAGLTSRLVTVQTLPVSGCWCRCAQAAGEVSPIHCAVPGSGFFLSPAPEQWRMEDGQRKTGRMTTNNQNTSSKQWRMLHGQRKTESKVKTNTVSSLIVQYMYSWDPHIKKNVA